LVIVHTLNRKSFSIRTPNGYKVKRRYGISRTKWRFIIFGVNTIALHWLIC